MSAHAASPVDRTSRLTSAAETVLLRVAFGTAGAAVSAGLAGVLALAVW